VYEIVGAALEVYYKLGRGFLEPVYQEAMELELNQRCIPFEAKKELFIRYKDHLLKKTYEPDFVCFGQVIVELKALDSVIQQRRISAFELHACYFESSRAFDQLRQRHQTRMEEVRYLISFRVISWIIIAGKKAIHEKSRKTH